MVGPKKWGLKSFWLKYLWLKIFELENLAQKNICVEKNIEVLKYNFKKSVNKTFLI